MNERLLGALAALCVLGGPAFGAGFPKPNPFPYPFAERNDIYKEGWIDLNKNGEKDTYEDPSAALDDRIDDLLGQMTREEKAMQLLTPAPARTSTPPRSGWSARGGTASPTSTRPATPSPTAAATSTARRR